MGNTMGEYTRYIHLLYSPIVFPIDIYILLPIIFISEQGEKACNVQLPILAVVKAESPTCIIKSA